MLSITDNQYLFNRIKVLFNHPLCLCLRILYWHTPCLNSSLIFSILATALSSFMIEGNLKVQPVSQRTLPEWLKPSIRYGNCPPNGVIQVKLKIVSKNVLKDYGKYDNEKQSYFEVHFILFQVLLNLLLSMCYISK